MEADEAPPRPRQLRRSGVYARRELARGGEALQRWAPFAGPPPPSEEQVDEFLLGLPVEAIERYVTTMEEGFAPLGESMRALAFWFRDKRDRWINSRMSSRDRAVVALAGRANALAGGCLADASDAGPGQLGLALALLGAPAGRYPRRGRAAWRGGSCAHMPR